MHSTTERDMMNTNRKILGAAAFSLTLAGGGVAGAMLGTPSLSIAQSASTLTAAATPGDALGGLQHRGEGLAAAAKALGMTEAELKTELAAGKSIADVAADQNVDVQTVIDALVAEAKAHLAEIEAALPDRMTQLVNREGWGEHGQRARMAEGLDNAAAAIGITTDELTTELRAGKTIADVAGEHDVDVQAVIDALVADATAKIDQAVADGKLDSTRADEMKSNLVERITARIAGEDPGPGGPPGRHGRHGGFGGPNGAGRAGVAGSADGSGSSTAA